MRKEGYLNRKRPQWGVYDYYVYDYYVYDYYMYVNMFAMFICLLC